MCYDYITMSKPKRKSKKHKRPAPVTRPQPTPPSAAQALKQQGLKAFRAGRLIEAIHHWEGGIRADPGLARALAEAYFRRALGYSTPPDQRLADLRRAVQLAADDPRYQYHLALTLHRRGDLAGALKAYQAALARDPKRRGAAFTAALAALESNPRADLRDLPGLTDQDRRALAPLAALLGGEPAAGSEANRPSGLNGLLSHFTQSTASSETLWQGLALLARGEAATARRTLVTGSGTRLPPRAEAVRRYYAGVAAAQTGDLEKAAAEWQQAQVAGLDTPWLRNNLGAIYSEQALAQARAGDWSAASSTAIKALEVIPGNATLTEIAVTGLDHRAHVAVAAGDWETAAAHWSEARELLSAATGVGSSRPILQNLAIACEHLKRWEAAAEAWRVLLRTRPRKKSGDGPPDAQWAWVRKRVITDYRHAGRPDQAVAIFRQAIKSDPDDLDARLQLVEALLANDQEGAAQNELWRILERDPKHVEALLRLASLHMERGEWYAAEQQLRKVLQQEPQHETARGQMARALIERGRSHHRSGLLANARQAFQQALTYTPDDYYAYIDLGRVDLDADRFDDAREDFERAFALAPDKLDAYGQIFRCWVIEKDMGEARKILTRAETNAQLTPDFYIHAGLDCLVQGVAPPPPGLFGPARPQPKRPDPWHDFGIELLDRAIALRPGDVGVYQHIVSDLLAPNRMTFRPDLALPYARRLVEIAPDDPGVWWTLGLVQGLNNQVSEAKETLRRGAQLARRQGNRELERNIMETRQRVGDPLFSLAFTLGPLLGAFDLDER